MAKKTIQDLYNEAKKRGYCSPYMRGQFSQEGFDILMLKLTEEVKPQPKPKMTAHRIVDNLANEMLEEYKNGY